MVKLLHSCNNCNKAYLRIKNAHHLGRYILHLRQLKSSFKFSYLWLLEEWSCISYGYTLGQKELLAMPYLSRFGALKFGWTDPQIWHATQDDLFNSETVTNLFSFCFFPLRDEITWKSNPRPGGLMVVRLPLSSTKSSFHNGPFLLSIHLHFGHWNAMSL